MTSIASHRRFRERAKAEIASMPIISPRQILDGIKDRQACVEEVRGDYDGDAGKSLQELYDIMSDVHMIDKDTKGDMAKRFADAGDIAMSIFRKAGGDLQRVEEATKAIAMTKTTEAEGLLPEQHIIPKGSYWSSNQGRAVARDSIMAWATTEYDLAEGDRFWATPKDYVGIAKVPTTMGPAWMLTAWKAGKCVSSQQTAHAFELMIFVDQWLDRLSRGEG